MQVQNDANVQEENILRNLKRPLSTKPNDENIFSPVKKFRKDNDNTSEISVEQNDKINFKESNILKQINNVIVTEKLNEDEIKRNKRLAAKKKKEEELLRIQAQKREQSFKALKYLLNKSAVYSKYLEERFESNLQNKSKKKTSDLDVDLDKLKSSSANVKKNARIKISSFFENGALRDYQLEGLEWLKVLYENGVNGILADEMGLGKTVQIIAYICYLYSENITGPFLICAPLSTLPNWISEFKRFAPKLPLVLFHGDKKIMKTLYKDVLKKNYVVGNKKNCSPIILTSFQTPMREYRLLSQLTWKYIIIDEGHRLKNYETQLYNVLQSLNSLNRLLLTGTPLQNNLRELWSLLHFLLPEIFNNYEIFESWIDLDELQSNADKFIKQEQETQALSMMHNILRPFVLRRLKTDVALTIPPKKELIVYCPLTAKQRELYKFVLDKNMEGLLNTIPEEKAEILPLKRKSKGRICHFKEESSDDEFFDEDSLNSNDSLSQLMIPKEERKILTRITMQNTSMMFRKIVNHPYLVHFPLKETGSNKDKPELRIDEELITQSGKMMMLDALTSRLIARGHKILMFSTLTMMLDIIEEFVLMRGYEYCRLDGTLNIEERQEVMESFNKDARKKIFLISTRAGGLGLNLIGADTVILYDSDWNPQADLQAQDRCHRIGQTKPVVIYQFVTRGTIDEAIIARGDQKRKLEKLIIQTDKFKLKGKKVDLSEKEDLDVLRKLLTEEEKYVVTSVEEVLKNENIDELLDRSDLLEQMNNSSKK